MPYSSLAATSNGTAGSLASSPHSEHPQPFLSSALSHLHAYETHSAWLEDQLWLPNEDGEPRRWCPPSDKGKELNLAAGRWYGHQPRVRGQRDSSSSCGGCPAMASTQSTPLCAKGLFPSLPPKKRKEGKWWYIRDMVDTKPNRC